MRHCAAIVSGVALCAAMVGCSTTTYQDVEIRDHATLPTVRVSKQVYTPRPPQAPTDPQTEIAIELSASGARGEDSQQLDVGDEVRIKNTTFAGPQTLKSEADFAMYDAAVRWRQFFPRPQLGYEALVGIGYAELDVSVSSPTQKASEKLSANGLRLGFGAIWRILSSTSLEWRANTLLTASFDAPSDFREVTRSELFLVQSLGRHAAIRAGYGVWYAETGDRHHHHSNIETRLAGPTLGLDMSF